MPLMITVPTTAGVGGLSLSCTIFPLGGRPRGPFSLVRVFGPGIAFRFLLPISFFHNYTLNYQVISSCLAQSQEFGVPKWVSATDTSVRFGLINLLCPWTRFNGPTLTTGRCMTVDARRSVSKSFFLFPFHFVYILWIGDCIPTMHGRILGVSILLFFLPR